MYARKVVKRGKKSVETDLAQVREELGMAEEKSGVCTVSNEIKIANVFGPYTSLMTGINLTFPTDVENFEREAARYHDRITAAIMSFQNSVLERVGVEKVWHGQKPPTTPDAKPAAKKRVPRKSR